MTSSERPIAAVSRSRTNEILFTIIPLRPLSERHYRTADRSGSGWTIGGYAGMTRVEGEEGGRGRGDLVSLASSNVADTCCVSFSFPLLLGRLASRAISRVARSARAICSLKGLGRGGGKKKKSESFERAVPFRVTTRFLFKIANQ